MMITAHPLYTRPLDVAAAGMERGFEGYVVPMRCTAEMLARRIRSEHIDPAASVVYEIDGKAAGILLVARRGRTSRVAAIGLAPQLRRQGFGRRAMMTAIDVARHRGDHRMLLEVIASNMPALALYRDLGFVITRRLVGYRRAPSDGSAEDGQPVECDPAAAAATIGAFADPNLPWQLAPPSLAGATTPLRGFAISDSAAALIDASGDDVRVVAFAVRPARRWRGIGSRLLSGLAGCFPGRSMLIPAIVPEGLGAEFLGRNGWQQSMLSQFEMSLALQQEADSRDGAKHPAPERVPVADHGPFSQWKPSARAVGE